ncbi:MAG: DUF445 family protein [Planctomycetes bacterium]|nr:DUF445 family protein [Planctomycetota bacterium]
MLNMIDIIVICAAPALGALIGYATNVIAVKMLFHPRKPRKFLFMKFHGLIPRRRADIAKRLAAMVSEELVTSVEIEKSVDLSKIQETLVHAIDEEISKFIKDKINSLSPLISAFVSDELIASLKKSIVDEIAGKIPKFLEDIKSDIGSNFNINGVVEEKVMNFSIEKLEEIMLSVSKQEFKNIERLGGVLGFIIGLTQSTIYLATRFC